MAGEAEDGLVREEAEVEGQDGEFGEGQDGDVEVLGYVDWWL